MMGRGSNGEREGLVRRRAGKRSIRPGEERIGKGGV